MRRDHSAFIGGFTGALGVLAAFLLCVVGGVLWVREQAKPIEKPKEPAWRLEHAQALCRPYLLKQGIERLSDDAELRTLEGDLFLVAHGLDKSGRLRNVLAKFDVGTFDRKEHWKIVQLMIDEKLVSLTTE